MYHTFSSTFKISGEPKTHPYSGQTDPTIVSHSWNSPSVNVVHFNFPSNLWNIINKEYNNLQNKCERRHHKLIFRYDVYILTKWKPKIDFQSKSAGTNTRQTHKTDTDTSTIYERCFVWYYHWRISFTWQQYSIFFPPHPQPRLRNRGSGID